MNEKNEKHINKKQIQNYQTNFLHSEIAIEMMSIRKDLLKASKS